MANIVNLNKVSGIAVFTTTGQTWTVPDGVTSIVVEGCGGGSGPTGLGGNTFYGGTGAPLRTTIVNVTPGDVFTATIGAGSAVVDTGGVDNSGGDSILAGSLSFPAVSPTITFKGGRGYDYDPIGGIVAKRCPLEPRGGDSTGLNAEVGLLYESANYYWDGSHHIPGGAGPYGGGSVDANSSANTGAGGAVTVSGADTLTTAYAGGSGRIVVYY